jgi:hypothetical protein
MGISFQGAVWLEHEHFRLSEQSAGCLCVTQQFSKDYTAHKQRQAAAGIMHHSPCAPGRKQTCCGGVRRHQRGGAGGIDAHAGPLQTKGVRHPPALVWRADTWRSIRFEGITPDM